MRAFAAAIALLLALSGLPTQAQIYKTTDAEGNVVYTDQPPAGVASESVELAPTNTAVPPPAMPTAAPPAAAEPAAAAPAVAIVSPANETTIPKGGGIFDVVAAATPALGGGRRLQLLLDGEPWGEPQAGGSWQLQNVIRGAHDLQVNLLDVSGAVIATSASVRVYVLRPSILN